jgi:hypothetical protein
MPTTAVAESADWGAVRRTHSGSESAENKRQAIVTVPITCVSDGLTHDVPDTELAADASKRNGTYLAVCGHVVAAAAMVEPDGEPCALCAELWDLNHQRRSRQKQSRSSHT